MADALAPSLAAVSRDLLGPELAAYLATLPDDADLPALAEAWSGAEDQLAALRRDCRALVARLAAVDRAYLDAPAPERLDLLRERALLMAEREVLPGCLVEMARRHTRARMAYLQRVDALIRVELGAATHALGDANRGAARADSAPAPANHEERRQARAATLAPLERGVAAARQALTLLLEAAPLHGGARLRVAHPATWDAAASDLGRELVRQLHPA